MWRPFKRKTAANRQTRPQTQANQKEQKVFSYYTASHKQLNRVERTGSMTGSVERLSKSSNFFRQHWFGLTVFLVLFVSSLYLLSLSFTPKIVVVGTKYRAEQDYQAIASDSLKANYLNMTKPTLQRAKLQNIIKEKVPEAKDVKVAAPLLGRRTVVTYTMDEPAAVLKQPNSQDLILSQRGRLLLAANQSKSTTNLPIIDNKSGVTGKNGEQYLRPDDMKSLTKLFAQIKASGSQASYVLPIQPREFTMLEPSRGAYPVKFLFGENIEEQFGALRAAQSKLKQLNQTPNEYIDVRLATKVFYK